MYDADSMIAYMSQDLNQTTSPVSNQHIKHMNRNIIGIMEIQHKCWMACWFQPIPFGRISVARERQLTPLRLLRFLRSP